MVLPLFLGSLFGSVAVAQNTSANIPQSAQVIDQLSLAVLETVEPPSVQNLSTVFIPPGISEQEATDRPFHIYDEAFVDIIGSNASLTLIATSEVDPIFHEAVVWYPTTDEVFFVQNAGAKDAGTGLNKSNIIQKISLAQAAAVAAGRNDSVEVLTVNATPPVINSNGATNFQGQIVFTGEGQGDDIPPSLFLMNPVSPYNTTVLINNYHGRQFNSLNDVAIHPTSGDIYFTDSLYGYLQDFRPSPPIPPMVYRFTPSTGAVQVVASDLDKPNGLTFSPDGKTAYVTDTGALLGFYGVNSTSPATIYSYPVSDGGMFGPRSTFAYVSPGVPDGIHCDSDGNVYAGCGDGVHAFDATSGRLLGKIFVGKTVANFRFVGQGRMVIAAETELYYAQVAAEGGDPEDQF